MFILKNLFFCIRMFVVIFFLEIKLEITRLFFIIGKINKIIVNLYKRILYLI